MVSGSVRKYILYALGEIFLVVIGILIALQVNNWNEARKLRMKGKEYIAGIYKEINSEINQLNEAIELLKEQDQSARYLLNIMEAAEGVIVDSIVFVQHEIKLVEMVEVDRAQNTWDELSASGSLGLLNDGDLEKILQDYYSFYDRIALNFNEVPRNARMKARDMGGNCFDLKSFERFHGSGFKTPPTGQWFSCYRENQEILRTIRLILVTCFWNLQWFDEVIDQAEGVNSYLVKTYPELSGMERVTL